MILTHAPSNLQYFLKIPKFSGHALSTLRSHPSGVCCKTGTPVATGPYHEAQVLPPASSDPHVDRQAIRNKRNAFPLCEKEKGKNNLPKKNSPRLLLLADLSFAIDAQHGKSGSLQDWYPGCNWKFYHEAQVLPPASSDPHVEKNAINLYSIGKSQVLCTNPTVLFLNF